MIESSLYSGLFESLLCCIHCVAYILNLVRVITTIITPFPSTMCNEKFQNINRMQNYGSINFPPH